MSQVDAKVLKLSDGMSNLTVALFRTRFAKMLVNYITGTYDP